MILRINIAEYIFVQDIFGTFVNQVISLAKHIFGLLEQAILEAQNTFQAIAGRAPPALFSRGKKGIEALSHY